MGKVQLLYNNMYSFYKQGNSLEKLFEWLKDSYGNDASTLMSGFMLKHSDDKELKEEFNKSCFI
jgi:CTP:phosphocholine cytidylyltransferase-like protein